MKGCLESALRLLGRRNHSHAELAQKLAKRGFAQAAIEQAIARCVSWGYLDEAGYASSMIGALRRRGYGTAYIHRALAQKKIPAELIQSALAGDYSPEAERQSCRRALEKKIRRLPPHIDSGRLKKQLYRFLVNRGFSTEMSLKMIEEFSGALEEKF